jgi:hypothetical protein
MDDEIDVDELDSDRFESLDDDSKDEVVEELAEKFLDDPDEALSQAEELGIDEDEIYDNL